MTSQHLHRVQIIALLLCFFLIAGCGLILIVGTASAQENSTQSGSESDIEHTNNDEPANATKEQPIDTSKTEYTIEHVTIHETRWYPDHVEIDVTSERRDTFKITDSAGDKFYWETYRIASGETTTISHTFRGDNDEVSFAVVSAQEGRILKEFRVFSLPVANALATLCIGLLTGFFATVAMKLMRDRREKNNGWRVF